MIKSAAVSRLLFSSLSHASFCLQVALVYPNNDPAAFMTAFYGCLLAEVVPVPIEVPLTRKVSHQGLTFPLWYSTVKHYADDNFVYMTCSKLEFTEFRQNKAGNRPDRLRIQPET